MKYCIQNRLTLNFVNYERKRGDITESSLITPDMLYNDKCNADDDVEILNQIDIKMPYEVAELEE